MKLKILLVIIILLIGIQFIPYGKNHTNPKTVAEPPWDTPTTRTTFFKMCGDCHSNETRWPLYSKFAPVSWLVQHDVDDGRKHLNVSMWDVQKRNKGDEAAHEYKEGDMPPWIYKLPRPETRLSQQEKEAFINGLKATFGSK
ncbi:MAG: heme-binding domain-containing protein [Desulfobulbus sp.]